MLLILVPLPPALFEPMTASVEYLDRNGLPLREASSEGAGIGRPLPLSEMPEALVKATLAAEDARFWRHGGVDWIGTARAAVRSRCRVTFVPVPAQRGHCSVRVSAMTRPTKTSGGTVDERTASGTTAPVGSEIGKSGAAGTTPLPAPFGFTSPSAERPYESAAMPPSSSATTTHLRIVELPTITAE
jgi:hypothetical protein